MLPAYDGLALLPSFLLRRSVCQRGRERCSAVMALRKRGCLLRGAIQITPQSSSVVYERNRLVVGANDVGMHTDMRANRGLGYDDGLRERCTPCAGDHQTRQIEAAANGTIRS